MCKKIDTSKFEEAFKTRHQCLEYLCELKWGNGFKCRRCNHNIAIKGKAWYYRKCQLCKKEESCTAQTLFHKLKFPLPKAFEIVHRLGTLKKGMSCCEISRQYQLHIKTAWFFRCKVQRAMTDGTLLNFRKYIKEAKRNNGANQENSVLVHVKCTAIGGKRKSIIESVKTNIKCNRKQNWGQVRWPLLRQDNCPPRAGNKGFRVDVTFSGSDNSKLTQLYMINLRNWMSGIHHVVSLAHLERYLQEFQYRFDRRNSLGDIPYDLLRRLVKKGWFPYEKAKAN